MGNPNDPALDGIPDNMRNAAKNFDVMNLSGDVAWQATDVPAGMSQDQLQMDEGAAFSKTNHNRAQAMQRFLTEVRQGIAGRVSTLLQCADIYSDAGQMSADRFTAVANQPSDSNLPGLLSEFTARAEGAK
ncbi:hypothetical protein FPZ12_014260 [Amycolatopsis acidicola]|uniref:Uncharacterized protein n=1 Tax=Amycolatopsis acidicola TaxID=2596893 RepID=A0A5N0V8H9_9PSEU|nr:hypothetical protein [Amycolatopsis acidicola]KAA9161311.1 hypothetical protein FPZ12_014260 [Amycolatopsis acidicola]